MSCNGIHNELYNTIRNPPPRHHNQGTERGAHGGPRRAGGRMGMWKCSACDCRRTAQGIMSDATSGVKERQHSGRRTKFPALSVCGVSTHSTFPPVRLPAASPPWAPRSVPVHFIFSLEKNMEKVLTKQTSSAIVRA